MDIEAQPEHQVVSVERGTNGIHDQASCLFGLSRHFLSVSFWIIIVLLL